MIHPSAKMQPPSPHTNSWFIDEQWCRLTTSTDPWIGPNGLIMGQVTIKGIRGLITPPWALHTEWEEKGSDHVTNLDAIRDSLEQQKRPLIVLDFPIGTDCNWNAPWMVQESHTRILAWKPGDSGHEQWPKHRIKQVKKGATKGIRIETSNDINEVLALHQMARERKEIPSNSETLKNLLKHILKSTHQSSLIARDEHGSAIANAVILHNKGRSIYAFGGQKRSSLSALASVMLIHSAIDIARQIGQTSFDFGGSRDPGVDRFYAEFGAKRVIKHRAVLCRKPQAWWLRWVRPDLFR